MSSFLVNKTLAITYGCNTYGAGAYSETGQKCTTTTDTPKDNGSGSLADTGNNYVALLAGGIILIVAAIVIIVVSLRKKSASSKRK